MTQSWPWMCWSSSVPSPCPWLHVSPQSQFCTSLGSQVFASKPVGHFDTRVRVCLLGLPHSRLPKPECLGTWTSALAPQPSNIDLPS